MPMKSFLTTALTLLISLAVTAQQPGKHVYIPGDGHLDVEQFIKPINTQMDISRLSLAELRILRNAFAARQGFALKEGDLRQIFSQTSWYDSLVWETFDRPVDYQLDPSAKEYPYFSGYTDYKQPIVLSLAEQSFIKKIQARETELAKDNKPALHDGWRFRTDNLLNPFQLEDFNAKLEDALGRNSFAIVPGKKEQLFHVYEKNDYANFPSFVTTDLYLQLFHLYFDCMVRNIEENGMSTAIERLCHVMYERSEGYNRAFFAIAEALITGQAPRPVDDAYSQQVLDEIRHVNESEDDYSEFLDYRNVKYAYSLFRPRGHYTRTEALGRYFRAMMWLQNVPFGTDKPEQLRNALLMADEIGKNSEARALYNQVFEPITFLFGQPDNLTILQVYDEIQRQGLPIEKLLKKKKAMEKIRKRLDDLGSQQTHIRPKFENTSHTKINLMPQRYMPDGEVLNEMIDSEAFPTRRAVPSGLDVFAAMGVGVAEQILTGELKVQEAWPDFSQNIAKMKARMKEIDWQETAATQWMSTLQTMLDTDISRFNTSNEAEMKLPDFMMTSQWAKKNLNTALASWAELKHDAILYAKQPMGAECGAGGPPDPVLKGYVEPNLGFWVRAGALNTALEEFLNRYNLKTEKITSASESISDLAEFLLRVAREELQGGDGLCDEDYAQIEIIGSIVENISLDLIREPDQYLDGWNNVEGADRSIACVADVYTANAYNNPDKSILYEATGPAYEIYVTVNIGKDRYLTRGAVFSYREFLRPLGIQRLTDEEWQENLKHHPNEGIPSWIKEIIVPLEGELQDNEEIFYSSGC